MGDAASSRTVVAFQLMDDALHGMVLIVSTKGHLGGSVSTDDQDPASRKLSGQVEEKLSGARICPMEILESHQKQATLCQLLQHIKVLLENGALLGGLPR